MSKYFTKGFFKFFFGFAGILILSFITLTVISALAFNQKQQASPATSVHVNTSRDTQKCLTQLSC